MNLPSYLKSLEYVGIPLIKEGTGHLMVQAKANGEDITLIVDTGASRTSLAESSMERLRLVPGRIEQATALSLPRRTAALSTLYSLDIGSLSITNFEVWIVDFSYINMVLQIKGISCDGVLGADVLITRSAVIDYRGCKLYLKENRQNQR